MNILVTGGSGFLGKHLCRALQTAGHEITSLDLRENSEFKTILADVRDLERMRQEIKQFDLVFHLASLIEAGESVENPHLYFENNITGTLNVLVAMQENGIKQFIFSSSAAVYGEPLSVPITEDSRTLPINPYGVTKLAMEGMLASFVKSFGFSGVALRYFNLYGPEEHHQPETHAIPRFIEQIKNGDEVTVWGDGGHVRDFLYIDDVVSAHLKALDLLQRSKPNYYYCNLSTGNGNSVMEIIKLLEEIMNKTANIKHFPDRPGDPRALIADPSKALELLGWKAEIGIKAGLSKTVDYFLKL